MTSKQKELLKKLSGVLMDLSEECEMDENFNEEMASINGFNYSLDDLAAIIGERIE